MHQKKSRHNFARMSLEQLPGQVSMPSITISFSYGLKCLVLVFKCAVPETSKKRAKLLVEVTHTTHKTLLAYGVEIYIIVLLSFFFICSISTPHCCLTFVVLF